MVVRREDAGSKDFFAKGRMVEIATSLNYDAWKCIGDDVKLRWNTEKAASRSGMMAGCSSNMLQIGFWPCVVTKNNFNS